MRGPHDGAARQHTAPATGVQPDHPLAIEYRGVTKTFQTGKSLYTAVTGIDLDIAERSFVSIVGPSGCGKSTLLNLAAGLSFPTAGEVRFEGRIVDRVNTEVGYVTQDNNLLPWRTVERNVGLALEITRVPRLERRRRVAEAIAAVGLTGFENRYVSQLSGGMQKRVALARTIIYQPRTLLMDEPFGALDAQLRMSLQQDLSQLCERVQATVLFVTHDLEEAILLGDEVVVFGAKPGRIIHRERVPFPRPRNLVDLRAVPEFVEMWERLWALLEPQIVGGLDS